MEPQAAVETPGRTVPGLGEAADPGTEAKLRSDIAWAMAHEIRGTPLVLVNGRKASAFAPFLYAMVITGGDTEHPAFASLPRPRATR